MSRDGTNHRPAPSKVQTEHVVDTARRAWRERMACVGGLVRELFGPGHAADPALMTRDAYLIVVARIIEALSRESEELSTGELAALSKALAEQRRLDLSELEIERRFPQKVTGNDTSLDGSPRPLPETFGGVVERIYGANLAGRSESVDADAGAAD